MNCVFLQSKKVKDSKKIAILLWFINISNKI